MLHANHLDLSVYCRPPCAEDRGELVHLVYRLQGTRPAADPRVAGGARMVSIPALVLGLDDPDWRAARAVAGRSWWPPAGREVPADLDDLLLATDQGGQGVSGT